MDRLGWLFEKYLSALLPSFTNILHTAFAPISLRPKSTNLKCKYRKAARKTFVQKSCSENVGEIDTFVDLNFVDQIVSPPPPSNFAKLVFFPWNFQLTSIINEQIGQ